MLKDFLKIINLKELYFLEEKSILCRNLILTDSFRKIRFGIGFSNPIGGLFKSYRNVNSYEMFLYSGNSEYSIFFFFKKKRSLSHNILNVNFSIHAA